MTTKAKSIPAAILISLLVVIVLVYSFNETILMRAGRFMAPQSNGTADVAILEGTEAAETGAMKIAVDLLSSRRVSCIVVVLHRVDEKKKKFGLDDEYRVLVEKRLKSTGLSEKQYIVRRLRLLITRSR